MWVTPALSRCGLRFHRSAAANTSASDRPSTGMRSAGAANRGDERGPRFRYSLSQPGSSSRAESRVGLPKVSRCNSPSGVTSGMAW